MAGDDIAARVAALPQRINGDVALLRRGRFLNATCQLGIGERNLLLRIVDGRLVAAGDAPPVTPSADFAIIAEPAVWLRLLAPEPPPGDHDIFAFVKRKEVMLVGNLHPLMSHLLYFKGLLAGLREAAR